MSHRKEKLPELLKHLAAEFIERESNRTSLITVTNASLSESGKSAIIRFTVLPESHEKMVLDFLERRKPDFLLYIDEHARVGRMPSITFALDFGEKNRQRIDFISDNS